MIQVCRERYTVKRKVGSIFRSAQEGKRRRGRAQKRCQEDVEEDLRELNVRRWRRVKTWRN